MLRRRQPGLSDGDDPRTLLASCALPLSPSLVILQSSYLLGPDSGMSFARRAHSEQRESALGAQHCAGGWGSLSGAIRSSQCKHWNYLHSLECQAFASPRHYYALSATPFSAFSRTAHCTHCRCISRAAAAAGCNLTSLFDARGGDAPRGNYCLARILRALFFVPLRLSVRAARRFVKQPLDLGSALNSRTRCTTSRAFEIGADAGRARSVTKWRSTFGAARGKAC